MKMASTVTKPPPSPPRVMAKAARGQQPQQSAVSVFVATVLLCLLTTPVALSADDVNATTASECLLSTSHLDLDAISPLAANIVGLVSEQVLFTVLVPSIDCRTSAGVRRDVNSYVDGVRDAIRVVNALESMATAQPHHQPLDDNLKWIAQFFPQLAHPAYQWPRGVQFAAKFVSVAMKSDGAVVDADDDGHVDDDGDEDGEVFVKLSLKCAPHGSPPGEKIQDLVVFDGTHLVSGGHPRAYPADVTSNLPIISLSPAESTLATNLKTHLVTYMLKLLRWNNFAIITNKHEDSLAIVKTLGYEAQYNAYCVGDIMEWLEQGSPAEHQDKLKQFFGTIHNEKREMPVVVISENQHHVGELVDMLVSDFKHEIVGRQFMFLIAASAKLLEKLQVLSRYSTIFTLTFQLPDIEQYNNHFLYLQKECKSLDGQDTPPAAESAANSPWRKWLSFFAFRSFFSATLAFNLAAADLCPDHTLCDELRLLKRPEFFKYLNQVEDQFGTIPISLGTFNPKGQLHNFLFNNGDGFGQLAKPNFTYQESPCSPGYCNTCIKFRQARQEHPLEAASEAEEFGRDLHFMLDEEESQTIPVEVVADETGGGGAIPVLQVETHEINIGLLVPQHKMGTSVLECSRELNLHSFFVIEAARWIIDKINQHSHLIPGIEVKLDVIDTCSSPFYATHQLAHLTSSEAKVQPIAFVANMPSEHYKQVTQFVSSINYTLLAAQDISYLDEIKFGLNHGVLQTAGSVHTMIKVLGEQLRHFGWRYYSVVVDGRDMASAGLFSELQALAQQEKHCFGTIENLADNNNPVRVIERLMEKARNGAKVVVMLARRAASDGLMNAYRAALINDRKAEALQFIFLMDQDLDFVHGLEYSLLGSIFLRESIGDIKAFDTYFLHEVLTNGKDPMTMQFVLQCGPDPTKCIRTVAGFDRVPALNTMQAILSVVGGFARMRNMTCKEEPGMCNRMIHMDFHRHLLSYIVDTNSMRIDTRFGTLRKNEDNIFTFTHQGWPDRSFEVLNYKMNLNNNANHPMFRFDTVAIYHQDDQELEFSPNVRYLFYKAYSKKVGEFGYNTTEYVLSNCVDPQRCSQCEAQYPDYLHIHSESNLLIAGVFDVRRHLGQNPLICDNNRTVPEGLSKVQAFLWTLDLINKDPNILPGVKLGAMIFDTCSSHQKIYRDLSNFLSSPSLPVESPTIAPVSVPSPSNVMGVVVDGENNKIIDSIFDLTQPFRMSVLTSAAKSIKFNDVKKYPQFIGLATPNNVYVEAIVEILKKYSWTLVSLVYETEDSANNRYFETGEFFKQVATKNKITPAAEVLFNPTNIEQNFEQLRKATTLGSKVVILFLSDDNAKTFFTQLNRVRAKQQQQPLEDLLYIVINSRKTFLELSPEGLNILLVNENTKVVPQFAEDFLSLPLQANVMNPWFTKFWEETFQCRGRACYHVAPSLRSSNVSVEPGTTNVINSVLSLVHGLDTVRRQFCPTAFGQCPTFLENLGKVSFMSEQVIRQNELTGLDNQLIKFWPNSNYAQRPLVIQNLQRLKKDQYGWIQLGVFDRLRGLSLATESSKVYRPDGKVDAFSRFTSTCTDIELCTSVLSGEPKQSSPFLLKPADDVQAIVGVLLPLHRFRPGQADTCGQFNSELLEKLVPLYYAIDEANSQPQDTKLGVLLMDSCAFDQQQLKQSFAVGSNYKMLSKLVAVLNFVDPENPVDTQVFSTIDEYNLFFYNFHNVKYKQQPSDLVFGGKLQSSLLDVQTFKLRTLVDLLARNRWTTVNLVYSSEFDKNYFTAEANKNNICVDRVLKVTSADIGGDQLKKTWDAFLGTTTTNVLVTVTSTEVGEHLIKVSDTADLDRFLWLGLKTLKVAAKNALKNYQKMPKNMIIAQRWSSDKNSSTLHYHEMELDQLSPYFEVDSSKIKERKALAKLVEQYWLTKFNCHPKALADGSGNCFKGDYALKTLFNIKETKHLVDFAKALTTTISKYIVSKCTNTTTTNTTTNKVTEMCLTNYHLRKELKNNMIDNLATLDVNHNNVPEGRRTAEAELAYELELSTKYGKVSKDFSSFNVPSMLAELVGQKIGVVVECGANNCEPCKTQLAQSRTAKGELFFADTMQSPLAGSSTSHRNFSIIVSVLSTLSMIVVVICVLYFVLIVPVSRGTTIIGYQILFGLFLASLFNFAYLMPSVQLVCLIRQMGLPLAYTIVFGGLLVKAYNFWCQQQQRNRTPPAAQWNAPSKLLIMSLAVIVLQMFIIFISGHRYTAKPMVVAAAANGTTGANLLQCLSSGTKLLVIANEVFLPLTLLAILCALIILLTVKSKDTEPKLILITTVLVVLVWSGATVVATTYASPQASLMWTTGANLVSMAIMFGLLFLRKLYAFSKVSRNLLKDRDSQYEPFADPRQQYGATQGNAANVSWSTISLKVNFRAATRRPFQSDMVEGDTVSTCASIKSGAQVQCQELYPMEVYDNQLQKQTNNATVGQSTRSVYDIIADAK